MDSKIIEIEWSWDQPIIQDILLKYYHDWLFNTPEIDGKMVDRVLSISDIQPPGQVLDVGCGLGYHAAAFAKKGFQVFAFDPGDRYLEIARSHIANEGVEVNLQQMKCSDLDETESFALAWDEFTDISTANKLNGDAPAQEGKHFAFWCRKPNA